MAAPCEPNDDGRERMRFPRIPPTSCATVSWPPSPEVASLSTVSALQQLVLERVMAKGAETKALQAFELTWVVYDPKDPIGLAMAFFTLAPVFVTLMQVSLVIFQRDLDSISMLLGQMISEVLNKVLKKSINQRRPTGARMSGSGMPSAHSQFSSFFASYAVAYTWSRMNSHRHLEQWVTILGSITLAALTCYSRVRLGYHSKDQVVVGALIGMCAGFAWHTLVSTVSPWLFPLVMQSRFAQFFYLRDISHIPDLIVYQHELCHSAAVASLQTVLP